MVISPTSGLPSSTAQTQSLAVGSSISYSQWLTPQDKALVTAAGETLGTGGGSAADRSVPQLAAIIAISRAQGTLVGPVTPAFLQTYSSGASSVSGVARALNYLESGLTSPQQNVNDDSYELSKLESLNVTA